MQKLLTDACSSPERPKPTLAFVGATLDDSLATQASQMVSHAWVLQNFGWNTQSSLP